MSVFLKFSGKTKIFTIGKGLQREIQDFFNNLKLNLQYLNLSYQGKCLRFYNQIENDTTIIASISLRGGKGGFGAKLKNQGGKKIRPNDNMFSRDAQGRKIAYQNTQRQYTQFLKKRMQQDKKVNEQRQQFKVMQDTMKQGQSFMKLDKQYNQQLQKTESKLAESIRIGKQYYMQKMKRQVKQNQKQQSKSQKKQLSVEKLTNEQQKQQKIIQGQQNKQDDQIEELSKPIKKIKHQNSVIQKNQKPLQKPIANGLVSAKDKLKSLFKK